MEQTTVETTLPDAVPADIASAFEPTPGEARSLDREQCQGEWRETHPDAHSAAAELVRRRKEAETAKTAANALREEVADSDIEEVSYLPGREPDGDLSPLKASRDLRDFRQQKAEAQQNQLRALLNELSPDGQPAEQSAAQRPELQQWSRPYSRRRVASTNEHWSISA